MKISICKDAELAVSNGLLCLTLSIGSCRFSIIRIRGRSVAISV